MSRDSSRLSGIGISYEQVSYFEDAISTVTDAGPSIANLVLDGILDDGGPTSRGDRLWRLRAKEGL